MPDARTLGAALGSLLSGRPHVTLPGPGRRAAVLILLYDRAAGPHLVLTKRTETLLHHRGQVSLPGGSHDPTDADLRATALRETKEELGVPPAAVRVLGRMDDVHTLASAFIVAPYVGVLASPLRPRPSGAEVARVLEVPLEELLAADARLPPEPDRWTLRYPLLGEDVWGATARILHGFAQALREALAG
jgi:8-oxo-dGTP pyrophosphatase MutT (NUDIX family)